MKGILKKDFDKISSLHEQLQNKVAAHNEHLEKLEAQVNKVIELYMKEHSEAVESNIDAINELQNQLEQLSETQLSKIDDYIVERSDNWHDSEAAATMDDWRYSWEEYSSNIIDNLDGYPFFSISFDAIEVPNLPSKDRA